MKGVNLWRCGNSSVYGIAMLGMLNVIDGGKRDVGTAGAIIAGVLVTLAMYAGDWVWDWGHAVYRQVFVPPGESISTGKDPDMTRHFAAALADNALLSKQVAQLRALCSLALHACDKLAETGHRQGCSAGAKISEGQSYKVADCTCGVTRYGIVLESAKLLAEEHMADEKKRGGYDG